MKGLGQCVHPPEKFDCHEKAERFGSLQPNQFLTASTEGLFQGEKLFAGNRPNNPTQPGGIMLQVSSGGKQIEACRKKVLVHREVNLSVCDRTERAAVELTSPGRRGFSGQRAKVHPRLRHMCKVLS